MNYAPMVYFKLLSGHFYGKADEGYGPWVHLFLEYKVSVREAVFIFIA
jgi:hypothetical protein